MKRAFARLRLVFAMLAWLAQALMPVAHAALMESGSPSSTHGLWCGDPANAQVVLASLPPEVRSATGQGEVAAEHLASCVLLCALGSMAPPAVHIPPSESLRAGGLDAKPSKPCCPRVRSQSPTPPAQAPPANA